MSDFFKLKPSRLPLLFASIVFFHTLIFAAAAYYAVNDPVTSIFSIVVSAESAAVFSAALIFFIIHKKLLSIVQNCSTGAPESISDSNVKFINNYSFRGTSVLFFACGSWPVIAGLAGFSAGIFKTPVETAYMIMLGELPALALSTLFYFASKVALYPLAEHISFIPLKLLHRFLISILSAMLLILTVIGAHMYRSNDIEIKTSFETKSRLMLEKKKIYMDSLIEGLIYELQAFSTGFNGNNITLASSWNFFGTITENGKNKAIEMFIIADKDGRAFTSSGSTLDISEREYFRNVLSSGKPELSEPLKSKITHKDIMTCAVPLRSNRRINGIIAATITLDNLKSELIDNSFKGMEFMLLSDSGKIYLYRDDKVIQKTIGKEITDGKGFKNVELILKAENIKPFSLTFDGKSNTAMKIPLQEGQMILLLMENNSHLLAPSDMNLIFLMSSIIFIALCIYLILWRITKHISEPIHKTVYLFKQISEGNLTVESSIHSNDEFGELIRTFNLFLVKIKEVMNRAISSSYQLSASSEELSVTSNSLADGAQQQAASVEQSASALQEISAAIGSIADNSKDQARFAEQTYDSMLALRKKAEEVAAYSDEAISISRKASIETESGNRLMRDAIERMDNIDRSTGEIAEVVDLIKGISEQVNLLSLNAAIEAARAGEHGRGFAIVAEEITKLAEQTAESTDTISRLVDSGRKEVELGRDQVRSTFTALSNILSFIKETEEIVNKISSSVNEQNKASEKVLKDTQRVKEMADSIQTATKEQATTNSEMVRNMDSINDKTQSAASAAEEIASSAEEISAQAIMMRDQMKFFKVS